MTFELCLLSLNKKENMLEVKMNLIFYVDFTIKKFNTDLKKSDISFSSSCLPFMPRCHFSNGILPQLSSLYSSLTKKIPPL